VIHGLPQKKLADASSFEKRKREELLRGGGGIVVFFLRRTLDSRPMVDIEKKCDASSGKARPLEPKNGLAFGRPVQPHRGEDKIGSRNYTTTRKKKRDFKVPKETGVGTL